MPKFKFSRGHTRTISRADWRAYRQRLQQSDQNNHSFSWIARKLEEAYQDFNRAKADHPDSPVTEKNLSEFLYRVEGVLEKTDDFRKPPKEIASYALEKAYRSLQEQADESARKAALWSTREGLSGLNHTQYGQALFELKEQRFRAAAVESLLERQRLQREYNELSKKIERVLVELLESKGEDVASIVTRVRSQELMQQYLALS